MWDPDSEVAQNLSTILPANTPLYFVINLKLTTLQSVRCVLPCCALRCQHRRRAVNTKPRRAALDPRTHRPTRA